MSKHTDPLLVALHAGKSYTWTVPDGGDFASMRKAIKHGQTLTMSPVEDLAEVKVGDIVLVKWHAGTLFHMVGEIQGQRFLIVNNLGKPNGWVNGEDILGRVTKIVDPEPRPEVPVMLGQLVEAYRGLIELEGASEEEAHRLLAVAEDLHWYAERLGPARWDVQPRLNKWSFAQNLWRLVKQARKMVAPVPNRICYFIDCGKQCVGSAAEMIALFEYGESE